MAKTVRLTAQEYQEKHARRLKAAVDDIRQGVDRVVDPPGRAAAAKSDKWVAAMTSQSVQDKWKRRVGEVTVDEWKNAMLNKGVGRIAAGVDGAQQKTIEFAEKLITHQNSGLSQLESMPDLTLEDSINRAAFWIRHMNNFSR